MRLLMVLLAALAVGCSSSPTTAPSGGPITGSKPHGGEPRTEEERAVKAFVLDNADDPKSVEFDRWGPNADADLLRAFREGHSPDMSPEFLFCGAVLDEDRRIVRCRFRSNSTSGHLQLHDDLYFLGDDGKVIHGSPNNGNDHWLEPYEGDLESDGRNRVGGRDGGHR